MWKEVSFVNLYQFWGTYLLLFLADSHVLHGLLFSHPAHVFGLVSLTVSDVRVSEEVGSYLVLHLSSHRPSSNFRSVPKYSVCGLEDLS